MGSRTTQTTFSESYRDPLVPDITAGNNALQYLLRAYALCKCSSIWQKMPLKPQKAGLMQGEHIRLKMFRSHLPCKKPLTTTDDIIMQGQQRC